MSIASNASFLVCLLVAPASWSQIPNAGFEDWTSPNGYAVPSEWITFNDMTAPTGVFTCTPGSPGEPGNFHLRLTTSIVPGIGTLTGVAISGIGMAPGGFPCTDRPAQLDGNWRFMPAGSDLGFIIVDLTKWNTVSHVRELVGDGAAYAMPPMSSWEPFSIPITYTSADLPDTATIRIYSSATLPAAGTVLDVDDLEFVDAVGVEGRDARELRVWPVPAIDQAMVEWPASVPITEVGLWSMDGRRLRAIDPGPSPCVVRMIDLAPGAYLVRAMGAEGRVLLAMVVKR